MNEQLRQHVTNQSFVLTMRKTHILAMAWEAAPLQIGDMRAIKLDESGHPTGASAVTRAKPPAGYEFAAKD